MFPKRLVSAVLGVLLTWPMSAAAVENTKLIIAFGGDPGSPLPHAYNERVPENAGDTYTLRIPVVTAEIARVFYDTVLTITVPDKIVQSVTAARAYRTLIDCNAARDTILVKLRESLPRDYAAGDDTWQYQSVDGKVVGRATCENPGHYPMPVLHLELTLAE